MSIKSAAEILSAARTSQSEAGTTVSVTELRQAWEAAKTPQPSDPPGKPISPEEKALFEQLSTQGLSRRAKQLLDTIRTELPALAQTGGTAPTPPPAPGQLASVQPKNGHDVFLTTHAGFAVDATGKLAQSPQELVRAFYDAGSWLQASFGSNDNLFNVAKLDIAGKRAVLMQIVAAIQNTQGLAQNQIDQLLGSAAALGAELYKSIETPLLSLGQSEVKALKSEAFDFVTSLLADTRLSALPRRSLVGYISQSDSFTKGASSAQKAALQALHDAHFPKSPVDYAKWDAQGKSVIKIDHACGAGENFVFGFVKQLQSQGIGTSGQKKHPFKLVSGNAKYGPCTLSVTIPKNDPANKWGRDMTIEINVRESSTDIYRGMGDASVDIVSYGGHSNFGANTIESLKKAPAQIGDKIILRDLCCGADRHTSTPRARSTASRRFRPATSG